MEIHCEWCRVGGPMSKAQAIAFVREHAHSGAGDAVAAVAKPIARMLGLKENCTPCEQRRRALNAALPWPRLVRRR